VSNFRRLLGYLKPYRTRVSVAIVLMTLVTLSAIPMPRITQHVIDDILPHHRWNALNWVFWAVVGIYAVRGVVSFALNFLVSWIGQRVVFDLRFQCYRHLNRLSLSYYDQRQTGKIMARVVDDINIIQWMIGSGFVTLITDLLTLVFVIPVIYLMDVRLAWIAMAVVPFYVINYKLFLKKIRPLSVQIRESWDALIGALQEKIAGITVVKAFVREEYETERFMKTVADNYVLGMQQSQLNRSLSAFAQVIRAIGTGMVYWVGARLVFGKEVLPGELVAFTGYIAYLYDPAVRLVDFNVQAQWAGAATDRVFETLDTRPEIEDAPNAISLKAIQGAVEFRNVTFGYDPLHPVLHRINLKVEPGEVIAIVGPSGAGKTSLVNLIARFYDVTEGAILIDGVDIRQIRLETVRRQIGYVSQESLLFSVSLKENIKYGAPNATDEQIVQAAKNADLHDFVLTLPDGYDTRIGEEGIKLSVGQKQRLAIARATLTDPRILILDDATSALDSKTEANVQEALEELMKGRTNFVIAHRLSTIMDADRIVVMEGGEIVDIGTHEELVERPGVYQNLYNEQFKSAQEEAMAGLLG
jgi:ABC-type multidrug transport system fused ATPase/permease subunit